MDQELKQWIKIITISLVISIVLTTFISPTLVKGISMEPTLHENDYLIMDKISYRIKDLEYGQVVVFRQKIQNKSDEKFLIKRIIGLPGDVIEISDGQLIRNGEVIDEDTSGNIRLKIPENKYFVLGDNRDESLDSRSELIGLVEFKELKGTILIRVLPLRDLGGIK